MPLQSATLGGNPRLENAASGGPSVKKRPPDDDPDAVKAIQRALVELGFALPVSFGGGQPDGIFGNETYNRVIDYQKRAFPGQYSEWDGRVGQKTLAKMDAELLAAEVPPTEEHVPAMFVRTYSRCVDTHDPTVATVATTTPGVRIPSAVKMPRLPGRTA